MEKKIYIMENLGCANCAAKMEDKFNAHPQVQEATIVFATRQLRLTAEDPDGLIPQLQELARTVEGGIVIVPREAHSEQTEEHGHTHDCTCGHHHDHHDGCGCGHHHDHQEGCSCGHHHEPAEEKQETREPMPEETVLSLGAVLFAAGLILSHFGMGGLSLLCCILAYVLLGRGVVTTAVKNLVKGHVFDENFLMSVATIGAFLIGEAPEAVGVMLFYRVGEYFEHRAVERSRNQIMAAVDLRPETVNLLVRNKVRITPAERVLPGALILVRPGDRIPLDGIVVSGESRIDTAPITGEPVPAAVREGDRVLSGCINTSGQLTVKVEKPLAESMVTRILDSVENAAASKPKIDRFITRFAKVYTPVVVAVAALTAVVPSVVTGDWNYWVYTALSFLVMSCPCALVLSVPLAFFSGIGVGSRKGILFKGGQSMEAMGKIKAVVMDKTGTLTKGDFSVQEVTGPEDLLLLCASCEQQSSHPIAASITAAAKARGLELKTPEMLEELAGLGIRAAVAGKQVLCGNAKLMEENGIAFEAPKTTGTLVLVAVDGAYAGCIRIADTVKPGAAEAVRQLKNSGLVTVMLTGDSRETAQAVAGELGLDGVHGGLLPHQKLEKLQALRQTHGAVMFVGDGINDAPVLAGADVGAAMGSGADAAIEAADVVFMTSDPAAIPEALTIAKKTQAVAWQNVIFALAVKLIVMVLGLLGFASMWLAVFADSGVAMLCVLNSIRMLYRRK